MGLLDEAIREHLELKRRQGADPNEVQRMEGEALGPPRVEPAPQDEPAAAEHHDEAPAPEAVQTGPAPPSGRVVGGAVSMDDYLVEHPHPEPRPAAPSPSEAGAEADDVLEETPEFLQETPEHERLWFEQKPPKDFDF